MSKRWLWWAKWTRQTCNMAGWTTLTHMRALSRWLRTGLAHMGARDTRWSIAGRVGAGLALVLVWSGCGSVTSRPIQITPLALTPGATTPAQVGSDDWTMYHYDPARTGYVAGVPDPHRLTSLWKLRLDGAVYAQPLAVHGMVLVATENDSLYALDARSGQVRWHTSVGTPVPRSDLPCGNIDPLGITGTPIYDPQTSLMFAVAEVAGPAHILVGVDVNTGQIKVRRQVDPPGRDPLAYQQRAALALGAGYIYVAFGGLYGDCGDYRGAVVASRTDGSGTLLTYEVPSEREAGIWAPPGPVIDTQGKLYISVGNGAATNGNWDHSDSVLRLSPTLVLEDGFAPQSWSSENATDADLGSMGPVLLPDGLVYASGKSGKGYLLRADRLGGVGGQLQTIALFPSFGGSAVYGKSLFIPCVNGLRQLSLVSGPRLVVGWHAPARVTGSPTIGGQTVYSLDPSGMLYALDAVTGAIRATIAVGQTSRFATPTLSHSTIIIGTLTGVEAASIS